MATTTMGSVPNDSVKFNRKKQTPSNFPINTKNDFFPFKK